MKPLVTELQVKFRKLQSRDRAAISTRFFKTGKGQYGEGDRFLGITVPQIRSFARSHHDEIENHLQDLFTSPFHEERMLAALTLTTAYQRAKSDPERSKLYKLYLAQAGKGLNNWDLVDVTAAHIVGTHLLTRSRSDLEKLVASKNLWRRRVAIIATYAFIRQNELAPTFTLIEKLLWDPHDLTHKACGWMLREAGKKNPDALRKFLQKHASAMPRTMLRYAIEKFDAKERAEWLQYKKSATDLRQ